MVATYESPRWLFSKNMDYSGARILNILRGKQYSVTEEITDIKGKLYLHTKEQLLAFKHRSALHPFMLVIILL